MYFQVKNILKINYYYNTIQTQKRSMWKKRWFYTFIIIYSGNYTDDMAKRKLRHF
jgi:hypothetical protein